MAESIVISSIIYAVASGISFISVWALIIAILRNPKLRSSTFDLYLVFCFAADAIYFTLVLVINVLYVVFYNGVLSGQDYGTHIYVLDMLTWCNEYYWPCASLWMSFAVFVQIYKLLVSNKQAKRYQPPTRRQVIRDSTIIHAFSVLVGTAIALLYLFSDVGYYYVVFLWTAFVPGVFAPVLLIIGMCFKVWRHQLMPPKNDRYRLLTMFFARLLASIFLMVIGVLIKHSLVTWTTRGGDAGPAVYYFYSIFYLFGFFQVCLALTKRELRTAFLDLWCCRSNSKKGPMPSTSSNLTAHPTEDESHRIDDKDISQGYDGNNDSELGNGVSDSRVDDNTLLRKN